MCLGAAPKTNNDIQQQQLTEAAAARWTEAERQNRVGWGSGYLDDVFGGGVAGANKVAAGTAYDPNATFYTLSGDVWKPMDAATVFDPNQELGEYQPKDAATQFADMLKTGSLYSGTQQVQGFGDNFYNQRRDAYLGYYQPQLDDQFSKAKDQLTFALARAGTLNSTFAGDKQAELQQKYDTQRASILSQADADVASARGRIANEKSALISQLNATGDADRVSNEALARTQQLFQERPAYNPLGDIFAGVAAGVGNAYNAWQDRQAFNNYYGSATPPKTGGGGVYTVY